MVSAGDPPYPQPRAEQLRGSGRMGAFTLIGIGVWLHAADSLVTATIAPAIVADVGGVAYINWTVSLYQVGAIIAGAAAAVLCARYGIKRVFIGATLMYGGGCVQGALAPDMAVLVGARFIQGLGGGTLLSLCYVAIEAWFAPSLWSRLFAFTATIWGGGSLLGPLIGGTLAAPHLWRFAFWSFAAQAALIGTLAVFFLPSRSAGAAAPAGAPAQRARRWPVLPLLILSVATLLIAEAGAASDRGEHLIVSAVGCALGAALLYLAARLDRRATVRLLPRQLLDRRHPIGAGLMMVFTLAMGTMGFWTYGPLLLEVLFGTKPLITGYILGGEAVAWSLATLAAAAARPADDRWLIRTGATCIAAGAAAFAYAVPSGSLPGIIGCALAQGAGFGMCWPTIVQRIVRCADADERSLASASVSTMQRIGYAVGTAAVGIAANMSGLAAGMSPDAARSAGFWVFAAFIPLLLLGVAYAWRFTARFTESTARP